VDYDKYVYSDITMELIEIDGTKSNDVNDNVLTPFRIFLLDKNNGELSLNLSHENLKEIIGKHYIVIQVGGLYDVTFNWLVLKIMNKLLWCKFKVPFFSTTENVS